ncbi:MAG: serine/threonine protein kinase [Kangiellaceae bacterium]|nr:serine/threonine protein kinase [Kangiellaceae bacterium]
MTSNNTQSFFELTPDGVLDAIESVGLEPQAALLALNSYENRVYQFRDYDEQKFVVKFYRPNRWSDKQILEEHRFSLQLAESEIPVIPPLVFNGETLLTYKGFRFSLFNCKGGRTPELEDPKALEWIGRFIGRIHLIGESENFTTRPSVTVESYAEFGSRFLLENNFIPSHIIPAYQAISEQLIEICHERFEQLGPYPVIRLHGDCHPSNILWTDDGPHFVDFDDARMGPAIQDLWMLINDADDKSLWNHLLAGYEDFAEFDDRQFKIVEPLRTIRMIHYSAWLAQRWEDPSFKHNFPWFNTVRYWEENLLSLKEQLSAIQQS